MASLTKTNSFSATTTSGPKGATTKSKTTTPSSKKSNGNQWCLTKDSKTCVPGKGYFVQVSAPSSTSSSFTSSESKTFKEVFKSSVSSSTADELTEDVAVVVMNQIIDALGRKWGIINSERVWNNLYGLNASSVNDEGITFLMEDNSNVDLKKDLVINWDQIVPNPNKRGGRRRRKSRKSLFKKKRTKKRKRRRKRKSKRKSPKRRKKTRRRRK